MKNILIIDDEVDVLEAISELLELSFEDKIKVTKISDSIDALIEITEKRFDLIFTDYKMPKLNGIELLINMYSINSSLNKETPVYIITGNAIDIEDPIIKQKNIQIISKPVRSNELNKIVESVLGL